MIWLYVILGVILILFISLTVLFWNIFGRSKVMDATVITLSEKSRYAKYKDEIKAGRDWINAAPCEEVGITSYDGLKLRGRLFKNPDKRVFLLFHGYHSFGDKDFSGITEYYINKGFNVIMVDQRAHGKSEGRVITFGVKERFDCQAWVDFAIERFGNDCEIFLGGLSMGSSTVLMALGLDLPPNVKGAVADCGYTSTAEILKTVSKRIKMPGFLMMRPLNLMCIIYGGFSMYKLSTLDTLKKSKIPVLLIHGDMDGLVPHEMTLKNFEVISAPKKMLIVKGADHGMSYFADTKAVLDALESFIKDPENIK